MRQPLVFAPAVWSLLATAVIFSYSHGRPRTERSEDDGLDQVALDATVKDELWPLEGDGE